MSNTTPALTFSHYQFTYQAINNIKIPPFPGQLLHGALGNALHKNTCVIQQGDCERCPLTAQCDYIYLFKHKANPQLKTKSTVAKQIDQPSPYVFRFHHQCLQHIKQGHQFSIEIILIGAANQKIDRIIQAMQSLGILGISNKQAKLIDIQQHQVNSLTKVISNQSSILPPATINPPSAPKHIRVQFLTPYIPTGKMKNQAFDIHHWIMGIIRRIGLLEDLYETQNQHYNFKQLKQLSESIIATQPQLYLYETEHTKRQHTTGILGSIDLQLTQEQKELWHWIYLGQWVHGGKKTSNGFGRYELLSL